MKMEWSKENVLQLIELVRRRPCLYNVEHESFLNKKDRLKAASELSKIISIGRPGTTIEDVLKKWDELCAQFLTKHEHIIQSKRGNIVRPFYYDKMAFVLDYISPKPSPKLLLEKTDEKHKSSLKCLFEKDFEDISNLTSSEDKTNISDSSDPSSGNGRSPQNPAPSSNQESDTLATDWDFSASLKDGNSDQENILKATRDKIHDNSPGEPSEMRRVLQCGPKNQTVASDEESISLFSYPSQHSPKLDTPGSIPSQKRVTSDGLLSPMREMFLARDATSCSQLNLKSDEDEDTLYMKYILCRLKKLDESQKVKLKFEIDKLFYQVLTPR